MKIRGFPGYRISDRGRVLSEKTDKILSPAGTPYKTKVTLYNNGKSSTKNIPRLVADHFIRTVRDNEKVVFKGHPSDMSVDNLAVRLRKHDIERKQYLSSDLVYLLLDIIEAYNTQTLKDSHIKALSTKINSVTHRDYVQSIDRELGEYCSINGVSVRAIKGPKRMSNLVDHRAAFSLQCRQRGYKLEEIGEALDRHYSTIINYISKSYDRPSL